MPRKTKDETPIAEAPVKTTSRKRTAPAEPTPPPKTQPAKSAPTQKVAPAKAAVAKKAEPVRKPKVVPEVIAPPAPKSKPTQKPKAETVVEKKAPLFGKATKPTVSAPMPEKPQPKPVAAPPPPAKREAPSRTVSEPAPKKATLFGKAKPSVATPAAPVAEEKIQPTRAPKAARKEPPKAKLTGDPVVDELPIPSWRPAKTSKPEPEQAQTEPSLAPRRSSSRRGSDKVPAAVDALIKPVSSPEDEEDGDRSGRRRRRRRKKSGPEEEVATVSAVTTEEPPREPERQRRTRPERPVREVAKKVEPPVVPQRESIPIPADAPRVSMINGVPTLTQNRKVFPALAFFGSSPGERQVQIVLDEMKVAAGRGIQLFGHLVELEVNPRNVDEAVAVAAYLLKATVEIAPEARVFFRVVFAAPRDWDKQYPKAKFVAEGGGLAEPSVSDDAFWGDAENCLTEFIRKIRMLPMKDNILGVHLERGEWFFADGWGYDTSVAAHEKFREWVRVRYRDDVVTLRASWFDGQAQFESVSIPEFFTEGRAGEQFVRTGRKARRWVDYHLFMSDVTAERIAKLAYAAKQSSEGRFLVGVSYGYTFEWSHPASGHLSLGKLLRTPEIDFIAGPPSYKNREPGGSSPFPCPIDSFALNGKLYISEEDFKTPISGKQEPDDFNPVMRTPQALESVHWRGAGAALAHGSGICWMDLWGNGWLNSPGIWDRGAGLLEALTLRLAVPASDPDVAVFIDERSLSYLVDQQAFTLLVQNVRESVLRSGLSVGFYLLSDLAHREKFPECKLYIFANAWDLRPEVRSAIKSRLQCKGKLLFWLYSAGLFEAGRESLERVREVMGIALRRQPFASKPGTTMLQRRHPLCDALPEKSVYGGGELEPSYFAIPEDGLVLGEYSASGLPSFIYSDFKHEENPELNWKSVFLGEPIVTPALFRALGQLAGAHVWNYHEDVVHVRAPFLTVHCKGAGQRTITLPDRWSAYNLLAESWVDDDSTHVKFNAIDGSTHLFLVGLKSEIEALLALDPESLLELSSIPEKAENTLAQDADNFDVTIMKLDEWMEESWSEEMEGDFLLKPSQLEFDTEVLEPASSGGKRGRRRRRGDDRKGSDEVSSSRKEGADRGEIFGEMAMNIVFRKRE